MKNKIIQLTNILLFYILASCTEPDLIGYSPDISVTGNSISGFTANNQSRTTENESLPETSTISLYSEGALVASGAQLTWNGHRWESDRSLNWNNEQPWAEIKAYHPAEAIKLQQFYNEAGELIDLLCAEQTALCGSNISLSFHHLFAKVTFRFAQSFNRRINKIIITPSLLLSTFSPMEQSASFEPNTQNLNIIRHVSPDGIYSLIVPANQALSLSLKIITTDKEYCYQLPKQTYAPGTDYIQILNNRQTGKGIASVEDYIAFTHLINGFDYPGRSLEEFGETTDDGQTIYYLLKDLTFTPEESSQVMEIGYKSSMTSKAFNHIFEGNYHTLKGLVLTGNFNNDYLAVFGYLGKEGIIRNLIIEDLTINLTDTKAYLIAGLAVVNNGFIDNCSILGFHAESSSSIKEITIAGICHQNNNMILNSRIEDFTLSGNFQKSAGMIYSNEAKIANSQIHGFRDMTNKSAPILCYRANSGSFVNILCSDVTGSNLCSYRNSNFIYCYYPSSIRISFDNNNEKQFIPYDEETYICLSGRSVEESLNYWNTVDGYALKSWLTDKKQRVIINTYGY